MAAAWRELGELLRGVESLDGASSDDNDALAEMLGRIGGFHARLAAVVGGEDERRSVSPAELAALSGTARELIASLLANRERYVKLGRSVGAFGGVVLGYIATTLVPGGNVATLLASMVGSGFIGDLIGAAAGEALSPQMYRSFLLALLRIHVCLEKGRDASTFHELIEHWKSLVILSSEGSVLERLSPSHWAWKVMLGYDIFPAVVGYLDSSSPAFGWAREFLLALCDRGMLDDLAFVLASAMYEPALDDPELARALALIYDDAFRRTMGHETMRAAVLRRGAAGDAGPVTEAEDGWKPSYTHLPALSVADLDVMHRERFGEPVSRLAAACVSRFADDRWAVSFAVRVMLAAGDDAEGSKEIFERALFEWPHDYDERELLEAALRLHRSGAASREVSFFLLSRREGILAEGRMSAAELEAMADRLADELAAEGLRDERSVALYRESFARRGAEAPAELLDRLAPAALEVLEGMSARGTGELGDWRIEEVLAVCLACCDAAGRCPSLDRGGCASLLVKAAEQGLVPEAMMGALLLRASRILVEEGRIDEAEPLLYDLRGKYVEQLDVDERMEAALLLGRCHMARGNARRAVELYKSVALVSPADAIVDELFSIGLRLLDSRPSLAREAFLVVHSVRPAYVSGDGVSVERMLERLQTVFDNYEERTIRRIGGGGMAEVFVAVHKDTGEEHVIKVLRTDFGSEREMELFRKLFSEEIRAVRRLNSSDHPGARHIVKLYHESCDEVSYAYSMERLDPVLSDLVAERSGPLPVAERRAVLGQVLSALACAHSEGVVHRDLNPRNVGFKGDVVKIFDFGTAHILRTTLHVNRPMTESAYARDGGEYILGTPAYMSPEQATGSAFDERTDIFSWGCMAFELAVGEMAFPGKIGTHVLLVDSGYIGELEERMKQAGVPAAERGLILRCLSVEPSERPASCELLLDEWRRLGDG